MAQKNCDHHSPVNDSDHHVVIPLPTHTETHYLDASTIFHESLVESKENKIRNPTSECHDSATVNITQSQMIKRRVSTSGKKSDASWKNEIKGLTIIFYCSTVAATVAIIVCLIVVIFPDVGKSIFNYEDQIEKA